MIEYRLNVQNYIIAYILDALENCSQGKGMMVKYDQSIEKGDYSSTLVFTVKPEFELNPIDFFWLGYYIGRDYDGKD